MRRDPTSSRITFCTKAWSFRNPAVQSLNHGHVLGDVEVVSSIVKAPERVFEADLIEDFISKTWMQ